MQNNKFASKENQSQQIQDYLIGTSVYNYNEKSPFNCTGTGLFPRKVNNKTYVDTETSLIRGQISQPIIQEIAPMKQNNIQHEEMKNDLGVSTRVKRPDNVLSGITIDRFEPLNNEQIQKVTRDEPRFENFGVDTRNVLKYT
tara:strand:- start:735 stop:1160 length:426 start_codon:yes stop_codon:yes gene_type:complete